jgi:GNAT superfamily N-acetyltransferase
MHNLEDYHFEVAIAEDLPEIVHMKLLMFAESGHAGLLAENASEIVLADYQRLYTASLARHFIAKLGTTIVGCAGAFLKEDIPFRYFKTPRYGFIGDVYIDPANRGSGIASRLSADALAWLRSQDIGMVRLLASEAGRPIYRRLGFVSSDEMVFINRAYYPE